METNNVTEETLVIKKGTIIEVKRLYIDTEIKVPCPNCNSEICILSSDDYLSSPQVGVPEQLTMCCYECDTEVGLDVQLNVSLTFDKTKLRNHGT